MSQAEVSPDSQLSSSKPFDSKLVEEDTAVNSLKTRVEGLTWMSESDYPFEISQLESQLNVDLLPDRPNSLTPRELLQLMGHDADALVEKIDVKDFFAPAIQPRDWHEEADHQRLQRFQTLLQWLEQHLSNVRVYRVGTIEINVYIVGKTESGTWISLSTKAIET